MSQNKGLTRRSQSIGVAVLALLVAGLLVLSNLLTEDYPTSFTIGRGEGLVSHVPYPVAIDVAERFELPVYRGKVQSVRNLISYDEARELEDQTDEVQVTVGGISPGDHFDLEEWTITPANGETRLASL